MPSRLGRNAPLRPAFWLASALAVSALAGSGCDDSFDLPDAGFVDATVAPDATVTALDASAPDLGGPELLDAAVSISNGNINPFSERAVSGRYTLRGRLRSSDPRPSESAGFKLRGGFVPLSPE